jgi:two-component system sensor histidine kinase DegS
MKRASKESASFFVDGKGIRHRDINLTEVIRLASIPISAHGHCHGAIAFTCGRKMKTMPFTLKELYVLNHFLHIAAIAIENFFMVEEIREKRKELRLLNEKMVSIQEDERKRLASDIHDGVAQALTAIGYKLEICKEISKKEDGLLLDQLNELLRIVYETVGISREMITNLRPDLIDNIGLIAALRHFFKMCKDEKGISVLAYLPKKCHVPPKLKICMFRVVQEALSNVYKHASIKIVTVSLRKTRAHIVLTISDSGKGFDTSSGMPWVNNPEKFGLLSMKERIEAVNGLFLIESGINRGCRIEAKFPVKGWKSDEKD